MLYNLTLEKMKKRPYSIVPYNPGWVSQFEQIKNNLLDVFGAKALDIQHVGSTSIVGMSAKPLIDVLVTVRELKDFSKEKEEMNSLGYEWAKDYIEPNSLLFYKTIENDQKIENIHICAEHSPKVVQFITTRDYFRSHPEHTEAYRKLKKELYEKFSDDYPAYREGKQAFLEETERLTQEWLRK